MKWPTFSLSKKILKFQYLVVIKEWTDDNDRHFVLMERIKGQTLEDAWPTLSSSDKERIADQVAKCLVQLRSL